LESSRSTTPPFRTFSLEFLQKYPQYKIAENGPYRYNEYIPYVDYCYEITLDFFCHIIVPRVRKASIEIEATNKTLARNSAAFPFSQQQQQQKQQQGLSSSLVNNIQSLLSSEGSTNIFASSIVQPVKETDDVLHFKLTAATIHQIFVDHPAVRVAYKRLVPEKMSEQEFWTKYLQSQYYKLRQQSSATNSPSHNEKETRNDETDTARTGTRRNKRTSAQLSEETKDLGKDELFTNENYDESAELKAKIREMDPTFSLIKEETEDDENSYGLKRDRRGKRKREVDATTAALIQKMNRHAALILDSFQDNQTMTDVETSKMSEVLGGTQPSSNVTNTLPSPCSPHRYSSVTSNTINNNNNTDELEETTKYRQLIQDKVTLRDLEDDESARTSSSSSASNLQSLLSPQCLFVSTDASAKIATKRDCRDYMSALTALKDEIKHWEPSRTKVYVPMEVAGKITETLFPSVLSDNVLKLPADVVKQLSSMYNTCHELLRHFWSARLQKSQSREARQKMYRLREALKKFFDKLNELERSYNDPHKNQLTILVTNMKQALICAIRESA
jgi:transcription initiation factor TFIIH subunit 1